MPRVSVNQETLHESTIFITRTSIILVLYLILNSVLPESSTIPLIICTFLFTTVLSQTAMLQTFKKKIVKMAYEINEVKELKLTADRKDLIGSVHDLKTYIDHAQQWNNRRRILFRQMTPLQQSITNVIEYPKKLNTVDKFLEKNNLILKTIVDQSIAKYDIKDFELKLVEEQAKASKRNNYYRVVESLCHYARDWTVKPCDEITPLLKYIKKQCADLDNNKTVAIVPGSGLGRVAHTLANDMKFSSVHAVEFSWLMVLLNEYVYSKKDTNKLEIYPYLHTYSNHISFMDQLRSVEIQNSVTKPESLTIHHGDFTKFDVSEQLKENEQPENLVLVTCFFLDTAENLVEYFQAINRLSSQFKGQVRWINVGPLKYGTAAKIEVTDEELKLIIQNMGWKITDAQDPKLLGYLTDKIGLWQGYYNVTMWTATKE